jgi:hypothetical protein
MNEKSWNIIDLINNNEISGFVKNNNIMECNEKRNTIFLNLYTKYILNIRKNSLFLKKMVDYIINNFNIENYTLQSLTVNGMPFSIQPTPLSNL